MPDRKNTIPPSRTWRDHLHEVIFEADTPAGQAFDIALLIAILISVIATCMETVEPYGTQYHNEFVAIEWFLTILFTIEYVLRIRCVKRPAGYIFSFYGIVDLLAILPTFVGLAMQSSSTSRLAVIRALRLLRVFRIFNLCWFVSEANSLGQAVWHSRAKIVVFLFTVIIIVTLAGTMIYLLEGNQSGTKITSIPEGIYWAIVTMTTVGYGDVVATTGAGKLMSAVLILLGYSLIIVPTGFVSAELVTVSKSTVSTQTCQHCMTEGHAKDAKFCRVCGKEL